MTPSLTPKRRRNADFPPGFESLAVYNAERARGIQHTPEWDAKMAALQCQWDERHAAGALGIAIRRARERKRWTQQQLADALDVNIKTVNNWETGRTLPASSLGALEDVLAARFTGSTGDSGRASD